MPAIPDETIDAVRAASDLVDVVGERVRLRKQGARFVGLCPFHNEKTPSFSVDPRQGLFYCFGCRKGGDVFKFVEEIEGVGFLDAVRLLADRAGIALAEEGAAPGADRRETMHAALRFAARFYFAQLSEERGRRGVAYIRERGFSREVVRAFGIGYAPAMWDALLRAATGAGFSEDVLEAVGLVKPRASGGGSYDVFRDRLMFPILSPVGKVLGFGGRILPDSPTASADYTPAKYINTAETEVYRKSEVLYGLKQARAAIRAAEEALLVEGYADVVSLHQAGLPTAVAASGTALTPQQTRLLATYARTVVLLYDADGAGQSAARRGIDVALEAGLSPYTVTLPDGADPDAFARQFGGEALARLLKAERQDFVQFLVMHARRAGRMDAPESRSAVVHEVVAAIARVRDPILAGEYVRRAADELGEYESDLRRLLEEQTRGGQRAARRGATPAPSPPAPRSPEGPAVRGASHEQAAPEGMAAPPAARTPAMRPEEAQLLRLMLRHGAPLVEFVLTRMGLEEFSEGPARDMVALLLADYEAGVAGAEPFTRGTHGAAMQALAAAILAERYEPSEGYQARGMKQPAPANPQDDATSAMRLLKLDRVDEAIEDVKRQVYEAERAGRDLTALQQRILSLHGVRRQIVSGEFLNWGA
ncbi:MAG: DNA primase [Rubricoccaceae bacterium]